MKAVVISGGNRVSKERVLSVMKDCDLLLCADSGADHAKAYGLVPDYVIGDMDSINPNTIKRIKTSRLLVSQPEKDYTDTHLAVEKAIKSGCDRIDILCATGLRSDHSMANIRLLLYIDRMGSTGRIMLIFNLPGGLAGRIIDDENIIYICTGKTSFRGMKGRTVSLMSMACNTEGITLEGFKYPLNDYNAGLDWVFGISNVIISDDASVSIKKGCLLVFEIDEH